MAPLQISRFMQFHRLVLLPAFVLVTFLCVYTSSIFRPYGDVRRLSFAQDVQCLSCESRSQFPSRAFLSLANFPTSTYIQDIVLRHSVLKVEDSRGDALAEPVSRVDSHDVESVTLVQSGPREGSMSRIQKEKEELRNASSLKKTVSTAVVTDEVHVLDQGEEEIGDASPAEEKNFHADRPTKGNVNDGTIWDGQNVEAIGSIQQENRHVTSELQNVEAMESIQQENRPVMSLDSVALHGQLLDVGSADSVKLESPVGPSEPWDKAAYEIQFKHDNMTQEQMEASQEVEKLMKNIKNTAVFRPEEKQNPIDRNLTLLQGAETDTCEGKRVFVYDLPSKFHADLLKQCDTLVSWFNFCDYFTNEGMGSIVTSNELNERGERVLVPDGSWYLTHQYALELIFHARLKHYPCLTTDADQASLFFVPYYAGLDVIRWHFNDSVTNSVRDELTYDLISWLETQESWTKNRGLDHVLVFGKIGWDFRRPEGKDWGSQLLRLPSMESPTKLLIERDPWHPNDVGVPHPTFFHPKDDDEIRTWLTHVQQSERRHLVSFAGMPRPNMLGNVRGHLIQQCLDHPDDCFLLRCEGSVCLRPDSTMNLFLHSHFCLQPPGDSPTRRSVFDSLVGGCIPVLFDPYTAYYQYPWHLPQNSSSYSVYIPSPHVMKGHHADILEILKNISAEERNAMRNLIISEIIPGLLYAKPGTRHSAFRDSFDISMEGLLNRAAWLRNEHKYL